MMSRQLYIPATNLSRRTVLGAACAMLASLALGTVGCAGSMTRFTLLCPESLADKAQALADALGSAGQQASITVESVSDGDYNAECISQKMSADGSVIAVLDSNISATDISGVELYETTSYFDGSNGDRFLRLRSDQSCYELPVCGEIGLLLCSNDVFAAAQCAMPKREESLLEDIQYIDSTKHGAFGVGSLSDQPNTIGLLTDFYYTCGTPESLVLDSQERDDASSQMLQDVVTGLARFGKGGSLSRSDLLSNFQAGAYAMVVATSSEYQMLLSSGASGVACSFIPGSNDEAQYSLTPAFSLVASSKAAGAGLESLYNWILGDGQQSVYDCFGSLPMAANVNVAEELADLYDSLCLSAGSVKLSRSRLSSKDEYSALEQSALDTYSSALANAEEGGN